MKSLHFLCLATILCSLSTTAQITKGNFMVGGSGSFSSKKFITEQNGAQVGESKIKFITITPNIGYFVVNKLALGLKIGYEGEFYPGDENTLQVQSNAISAGPFVRYYFLKPENFLNVFAETNINLGNKHYSSWATDSYNTTIKSYALSTGAVIFFNSSVGLEFMVQYSGISEKYNESNNQTNDFQIRLGFQIHLEKNN